MNKYFYFLYGFRLIELLSAAGFTFLTTYCDRQKPNSTLARFVRHRDRVWFALMLLVVPTILSHCLFFRLSWSNHPTAGHVPALKLVIVTMNVINGCVYGLAGCLFASPSIREERFNFWIALVVVIALLTLMSVISMIPISFGIIRRTAVPFILLDGILALAYLATRGLRGKETTAIESKIAEDDRVQKAEVKRVPAFLWLFVGLLPIPIALAVVSTNSSASQSRALVVALFIIGPLCNLIGGIGCLSGIKNIAVRIILGLFLAAFFFGLTALVALFEACSHSSGF